MHSKQKTAYAGEPYKVELPVSPRDLRATKDGMDIFSSNSSVYCLEISRALRRIPRLSCSLVAGIWGL